MTSERRGILPDGGIRRLIGAGAIRLAEPVAAGQVQPASLDLRLGPRAYRVRASFLPGPDFSVTDKLAQLALHEFDITGGAVLETGLRLHCAAAGELGVTRRHRGQRQSQELDGTAGRLHPCHHG
jgi:hypothetical protein